MDHVNSMRHLPPGVQYLDYLQMGVMVLDSQKRIVYWNQWLESHSNIMYEAVEHQLFQDVFPMLENSRLDEVIGQALEEKLSAVISASLNKSLLPLYPSVNHQLKQMDYMRQMVHVSSISDDGGNVFALLQVTDMTHAQEKDSQLRERAEALQNLIGIDELTLIANREKYDQQLAEEFSRAQRSGSPLLVGLVDVDNFKLYNEHYGEAAGDECLAKVASTFRASLNRSTDFIARYSGQVFGVILPCTSYDGGVYVAEDVRGLVKGLDIEHEASSASSVVTVSAGFAYIEPKVEDNIDALIDAANFALNQAKASGGDKAMIYVVNEGGLYDCNADSSPSLRLIKA